MGRVHINRNRAASGEIAGRDVDLRHVSGEGHRVSAATMKLGGDEMLACDPSC
jgi:hypothetical protein